MYMQLHRQDWSFCLTWARVGLLSVLAVAAVPSLAADTTGDTAAGGAAAVSGNTSEVSDPTSGAEAAFVDGWVDGNGVWYPYCTNSGDTGGGFGWQPELGGPHGGSCKIGYGGGGGGGYGTPPQPGMIWVNLGGGRWGWGWGRGGVWRGGRVGGVWGGGRVGGGVWRGGRVGGGGVWRGGRVGGGRVGGGWGRGGRRFADEAVIDQQDGSALNSEISNQP